MQGPQTEHGAAAQKLVCFDALRGLAAFVVLIAHILLGFWPIFLTFQGPDWDQRPGWLRAVAHQAGKLLWNGELAVSIFFVLSGFVLSLIYFQTGSAPAVGSAATRRYLRLMLPAAASIFLSFTLLRAGIMYNQAAIQHMNEVEGTSGASGAHEWLALFYNFNPDLRVALREATWDAFTTTASYNLVLWTMPIELVGSFLVYGFLALFGSLRNRCLLYGVVGTLLIVGHSLPLLHFVLGMAMCDLWVCNRRRWQKSLALTPALVLVGAGIFLVGPKVVAAVLVVGATAACPRLQELLTTRWLAWLGRLSFGLYLVHMPIFCSVGCGLYLLLCRDCGWSHGAGPAAAALATVVASLLTAWLFYHLVDRPTLALTRRLEVWLFRPRSQVQPALVIVSPARGSFAQSPRREVRTEAASPHLSGSWR